MSAELPDKPRDEDGPTTVGKLCPACGAYLEHWQTKCDMCPGPVVFLDRDRQRRAIYNSARWRETSQRVTARGVCIDCRRTKAQLGPNETMVADHRFGVLEVDDPYDESLIDCRCSTCSGRKDRARR